MKTIDMLLSDIKPYENNPRFNEKAVDAVARSIKEFGFQQPLVLDKENVIIVGHTRFKASQKLGLEKVPCVIADNLTEEQCRAYRLADNKVGELAEWNMDLLEIEMGAIESLDMELFGFDTIIEEEEQQPKEREDLSGQVGEAFEVIIECDDEAQQEELFNRFTEEGLKCRILIL